MNNAHLSKILKEYGKFHAISLAMRHRKPETFQKLAEKVRVNMMTDFFIRTRKVFRGLVERVCNHLEKVGKNELALAYRLFDVDGIEKLVKDITKRDKYSIISHGDSWCNNFMFKYKVINTCFYKILCCIQINLVVYEIINISYIITLLQHHFIEYCRYYATSNTFY